MVKNTKGGNKSKGLARKHLAQKDDRVLRLASCDLEKYAVVTKVLGHGMFYAATDEQEQLLGHIRNKFRGRSKRDNSISVGGVVLIGLREWEHPEYKECDLLEVYDANEIRQLSKNPTVDFAELHRHIEAIGGSSSEFAASTSLGEIEFETETTDYTEGLIPDDCEVSAAESVGIEETVDADDI